MHVQLWLMLRNLRHVFYTWILNTFRFQNGWNVTWCCSNVLIHLSIWRITSQKVITSTISSTCGFHLGSHSSGILSDIPQHHRILCRCGWIYGQVCPFIFHYPSYCRCSTSTCSYTVWLCRQSLDSNSWAWALQFTCFFVNTQWIVGGCYRRYVDRVS